MPACDTDTDPTPAASGHYTDLGYDLTQLAQRVVLCESVLAANPAGVNADPVMATTINTTLAIWGEMLPPMDRETALAVAQVIASGPEPVTAVPVPF